LDSHTAARLVRLLHETARKGTIVVLSVHQPSQATFEEFDQVLLMSKRGRVVYFGPQRDIYGYFEKLGHACAPGRNFADHMLQVVSEAKEFDDPKWVAPHEMTRVRSLWLGFIFWVLFWGASTSADTHVERDATLETVCCK
jgi:ABC-type multidrug transport system ATPase subunit